MKTLSRLAYTLGTVILLFRTMATAPAADISWLGGNGSWDDPSMWSPAVVPGTTDTAIINSGTVTADNDLQIATLTFTGGTLAGGGQVTVTGTLNWTGGSMTGAGKTVLANTATASWTGAGDKWLNRNFDNLGTISFDAGRFVFQSAIFNNEGQMTVAHAAAIPSNGGANQFNNNGTLSLTSSGVVTFSGVPFNNSGTLNWPSGSLVLDGGGQNTTTINVPAGSY
ncbi:hypothetical protein GC207_14655, partial [bacterium]|nr:hypothetical protein [bacterium]